MPRTVTLSRGVVIGLVVVAAGLGLLWLRGRRAAAAQQSQQPSVSATAPAPVPSYGANMPAVVDVVQGPPGTTTRVTDLRTGQRVI